jgi:hypothetical protein
MHGWSRWNSIQLILDHQTTVPSAFRTIMTKPVGTRVPGLGSSQTRKPGF